MANASQQTSYNPWATANPFLTDVLGKAQGLYGSTAPLYGNPASNFGYGSVTGALGDAINGTSGIGSLSSSLSPQVSSAISSELSGQPDYTAVQNALDAANTQQWNQFYNQVVPQLNQRASFLGNPSGAIKDLNSAVAQIGQNQSLNAQQAYLGQYNQALQRQSNAAALGTNIAQTAGSQSLQGASMFPELSSLPQQNLANYAGIVNSTAGRYGTGSTTLNPGSAGTAANIIGGLTAGAGLYNTLFPKNGGGLGSSIIGGIGKLFGGGNNYNGLNNYLNNYDSSSIINQYGASGLPGNTPDYTSFVADPGLSTYIPDNSVYTTGDINWGDTTDTGFSGAGGQAATQTDPTVSNIQSTGITPSFDAYSATAPDQSQAPDSSTATATPSGPSALGTAENAYGIYQNFSSGTTTGDIKGTAGVANVANQYGAFGSAAPEVSQGLGALGGGVGLVSGIQQGGVGGGVQAAGGAAQIGAAASSYAGDASLAADFGGAASALGAVGGMYALWQLDQQNGIYTPAMQYAALENTPQNVQTENQQLQDAISSGHAVMNPITGQYEINGIPASIYYPLAGKTSQDLNALNAPLAQNFLADQGTDWNLENIGITGGALRPQVSHSINKA